jgi:TolB-like protein/Flp pilus assembly protein TadD
VAEASHAVFLSYASQDAVAAQRIAEALRSGDIEVFLDQSELRGGDAWDKKIRHEIRDCVLFIPIVSRHAQERLEGYFRHEWNLAIERTHHMAENKAFLVPVVVDGTPEHDPSIPEKFRELQWTHLPAGETPPAFVTRIKKLLSGESGPVPTMARRPVVVTSRKSSRLVPVVLAVVLASVAAYLLIKKPWVAKQDAFSPPPHSIAVLPFVNISSDKEQEYFSDGLTEELLNSLAQINELHVAARTSAFSFKSKDVDIGTIARKLNVGAVLEGSVRRSGNTVRIATQLINAVTGFDLWSHTYDRDLSDVLKLQTEIADAVARALKVSLLADLAEKIERGGTHNPAAFDAYLRAQKAYLGAHGKQDTQSAIAGYSAAIALDSAYALAFAGRSIALIRYAVNDAIGPEIRENFDKAQSDAMKAIELAPDLAEGHIGLASSLDLGQLDFARANEEYERALALAPGSARVLADYARFAVLMGRKPAAIAAARRATLLDPLNRRAHAVLGFVLFYAREYDEAIAAYDHSLALDPDAGEPYARRGLAYYLLGQLQRARQSCEAKLDWYTRSCLAIVYGRIGRHADAETMLRASEAAQPSPYTIATAYAQWGNIPEALGSLETAMRTRAPGLEWLKADPLLDPLRKQPRFQAIERELKFPN